MIAILDITVGHIYFCDTKAEASMIRRMLDLMGSEHQTLETKRSRE